MDVFYVLSGFLITGLLWEELEGTGRLRFGAFYARRARRLLPAAALVLGATLVASVVWLSPLQVRVVATDAVAAALYVANYRFAALRTDYLADASPSPLQHYWSLGVEEQFYLLWPLLLLAVFLVGRRLRVRSPARAAAVVLALAGAGSFALSLRLTAVSQPWAFFSLPTRAWELAAGDLLALATVKLVEDPVRFSPRLRTRPARSLALGAGLTTVAVTAAIGTGDRAPQSPRPGPGPPASRPANDAAAPSRSPSGHGRRPGRGATGQPVRVGRTSRGQGGHGAHGASQPGTAAGGGPRRPAPTGRRRLPHPLAGE